MLRLRSTLFMLLFRVNFAMFLVAMLPTLAMRREAVFVMGRLWGRSSLWLLRTVCGLGVEFRGLEHLQTGGVIIAAKHQAEWETFALLTRFSDYTFVMKKELLWIPLFGWYMRKAGQLGIDRSQGAAALKGFLARAGAVLAEGRPVLVFPEGTRRPVGAPPSYKPGIARVYASTGAPCVPVALNSGLFWPRGSWIRRPGTVVVEFLPPIGPGLGRKAFLRELEARLETATNRLVAEALAANPALQGVPESQPALGGLPWQP